MADRALSLELTGTSLAVLLLLADAPRLVPVALGLIVLPWLLRLWRYGRLAVRTALDGPWAVFVLTAAMGVWAAYDQALAWPRFRWIVAGLGLYYALVNVRLSHSSDSSRRIIHQWSLGLCLFVLVLAAYFMMQRDWVAEPVKFGLITRIGTWVTSHLPYVSGPYLHANTLGGVLAVVWPVNAALVFADQGPRLGIGNGPSGHAPAGGPRPHSLFYLSLVVLVINSFALIMTGSRGAWMALGTAGGLWLLSRLGLRGVSSSQVWAAGLVVGAVTIGIVLLLSLWAEMCGMVDSAHLTRWVESLPVGRTAPSRLDLYRRSLTLVRDYPLTGIGLGCFTMVYSTYALLLHVGFLEYAHNLFLDLVIQQSIFGLAAFLCAVALVVRNLWRTRSPLAAAAGRPAAALSLAVLLIHGLVDDALYAQRLLPLMFVPFGLVMATGSGSLAQDPAYSLGTMNSDSTRIRGWRVLTALLLGLDLAAASLVWRGPLLSLLFSDLGSVHQTKIELGEYEWPAWPIQDAVRREVDLSRSVAELERALAYDVGNATANRRLGMIKLSLAEYEAALSHLAAAYEAEPGSKTTRQLLGEALIVTGHAEAGRMLWSGLDSREGQLEARAWWYTYVQDSERAEVVAEVAAESEAKAGERP